MTTNDIIKQKKIDVLFIIPPYHHRRGSGSFFPLGISSIISCLEERGFTWDYIDCTKMIESLREESLKQLEEKLSNQLKDYAPLLVGIGPCVTPGAKGLKVVANSCLKYFDKEMVFAGGPFASLLSQEWFFYDYLNIKYLIKGDGEYAVCDAINTLKKGLILSECNAISFRGYSCINYIEDINSIPFPKRIDIERNRLSDRRRRNNHDKVAQIVGSRGCPYHCDFCFSGNTTKAYRKRSPDNIVEEMKQLVDKYQVTDIVFYDDCFFSSPQKVHSELKDFCNTILNVGLTVSWQIEIRPDTLISIADEELLLLTKCGCRQINIGIERTGENGATAFGKAFCFEKLRGFIMHLHEICPIRVTGTFILGGKDETKESIRQMIKESTSIFLDDAEFSPLFVYPETNLYDCYFSDPQSWFDIIERENEPWGEIVYENKNLTKDDIIALVDEAYSFFYKDKRTDSSRHITDRYNLKEL